MQFQSSSSLSSAPRARVLFVALKQSSVIVPVLIALTLVVVPELASADVVGPPAPTTFPGAGVAQGSYRICEMTQRLFDMIEGNTGALIMVLGGILAVVSAAFGAYRSAVSLLVIAVGAFILRSLVEIFFNYASCTGAGAGGIPPFFP